MAIIKCKMCGGDLIIDPDSTVAECEYCGSRQTVPTADNEKKLTLFARANRLRSACEFDKAAGIYETIVADFPEEAEAYWGLVLCRYGIEYVDDPATGKKIPTCHRSGFDSVLEDGDFEQALENADAIARKVYREEAKQIEELRKSIIEVSGKEEPYDIFICYKETDENGERTIDSVIAQDVYDVLTDKGYRVFFSRITLEDKLGQEYEPYIFAALNSAKIMLVFGTDYEYFNAVWVKNEWSRYLKLMVSDKTKHLIPCYKGIDAYDMPKEFARLQAQDMGKVGAIQDLLRGISKILVVKSQPATVGYAGTSNADVSALTQRGNMALEDGDFENAMNYFERALDANPSDARAYLGKFLAFNGFTSLADLDDKVCPIEGNKEFRRAEQFADPALAKELKAVKDSNALKTERLRLMDAIRQITEKKAVHEAMQLMAQCTVESYDKAIALFDMLKESKSIKASKCRIYKKNALTQFTALKFLRENLEVCSRDTIFPGDPYGLIFPNQLYALNTLADAGFIEKYPDGYCWAGAKEEKARLQREQDYKTACEMQENAKTAEDFGDAAKQFMGIGNYADCRTRAEDCRKEAERLTEEKEKAVAARREQDYKAACEMQNNAKTREDFRRAAEKFKSIGDYADCYARVEACCSEVERLTNEARARSKAEAEKAASAQKRKKIIISTVAVLAVSLTLATVLLLTQVILPQRDYRAAEALLGAGDYDGAADAFAALGDYKDAAERVQATYYAKAEAFLAAGDYDSAVATFAALGDEEQVQATRYTQAEVLLATGDYDGTVKALSAAGDYKDAAGKLKQVFYSWGEALLSEGNAARAAMVFSKAGDYLDAEERSAEIWNAVAVRDTVSAGGFSTVGLKSDGTVVAVGNIYGSMHEVSNWTDIVAVSAGYLHTVGLKSDGTVVAVGDNDYGQCNVSGWTEIVAISAGNSCTVALRSDGTVVAVGNNYGGMLDEVSNWTDIVAVSVGSFGTVGLRSDGTVLAVERSNSGQYDVSGWTDIVAVSAGGWHAVGLRSDGIVVAVGINDDGRLDEVSNWTDIVAVSAGAFHTVGLRSDGTVVAVGTNEYGQCDVSGWTDIVAVSAGEYHTVGLKSDGTVVAVGATRDFDLGQCDVSGWTDIKIPNSTMKK